MQNEKEWLTDGIAREFQRKAAALRQSGREDVGELRRLKVELMNRCGVTELEALNILNGYNVSDYIRKYEILSGKVVLERDEKKRNSDRILLEEMAEMETRIQMQVQLLKDMMD